MSSGLPVDAGGEPRTVVVAGVGTNQLAFTLPPGVAIDVESVYAAIDASGASGGVTATLTVSEQTGVVIAAKRQGETVDAGGLGSATWALRLADESSAATAAGGFEAIGDHTGVSVPRLTPTLLPFVHDFGGSLLNLFTPTVPTVRVAGTYAITVYVFVQAAAAAFTATIRLRMARSHPTFQSWVTSAAIPVGQISSAGPIIAVTRPLNAGDELDVLIEHDAATNRQMGLLGAVTQIA